MMHIQLRRVKTITHQDVLAIMFQTYIWMVLGLDLGWDTNRLTEVVLGPHRQMLGRYPD